MTERAPSTELKIRVSPTLRAQIEAAAQRNQRTMNAEVVARLTWAFEHDADGPEAIAKVLGVTSSSDLLERRVAAIEKDLEGLVPDFTVDDRLKRVEADLQAMKLKIGL